MFIGIFVIGCVLCSICSDSTATSANLTSLIRKTRQSERCILPSHPHNGQWILLNGFGSPGDEVQTNSILEFSCSDRFKLSIHKHVICIQGWNVPKMPECEPICEARFSTSTTFLNCFNRRGQDINCTEATSGSYMRYDCAAFYEPTPGQRKIMYCTDGFWSHETPECRPICGQKNDAMGLIYGGNIVTKVVYPWVVAIFKKDNNQYINICGGTIIHRKAVLTAAHCVTNEYSDLYPVEDYSIAAAKLYNGYGDSRDKEVQYLKVSRFIVHSQFKGDSRRFLGDIALMIPEMPFKLNTLVRPVCINDLVTIRLQPGSKGEIAGWGATETGLPSEELRALEIPHKDDQVCVRELPPDWAEKYNLIDKMCAGYPEKNVSVCKGDSGSGLSFKNLEDGRYYVHGIVSLSPSTKTGSSCNILTNALYTKVSFYYDFIDIQLNRLNWCKLPNYPENGKWSLRRSPHKVPGDIVSPFDIVEVFCNTGYNLTSPSSIFSCEALVLSLPSCTGSGKVEQKVVITPSNNEECGRKINGSTSQQIAAGETVLHLDYPWAVGIYRGKTFHAHGTIVSKKLVMSSARFLSDGDNWTPLDPEKLTITTGKYYWNIADPRDSDATLYGLEKVYIYPGFKGVADGLQGDFGFAVIKGTIEFTQWVKPVCVRGVNNIPMPTGTVLEIVGWVNNHNTYTSDPHVNLVPLKTVGTCLKESDKLSPYVSPDAICGGTLDSSICVRHIGAGLTYGNPKDGRYYLAAIFAFALRNCEGNNTFYLNVKYHYDYIIEQIDKYS